ncbi:hypothetical protein RKE30_35185 [Streptomyces sp. Li-HN-5-11]|uniref:hypothetical protein n=1 Tax=Streptomyces sp. Li-HN-5-11 TaxID=3075432 RepID=UPI0028B0618F|nr:hypothetical protein [Streptomyces sp. Li-HN-5-11]WNM35241.1 hypothetical protein RKE30_35185 [Streptomyces sp. Li-HN-5-11]
MRGVGYSVGEFIDLYGVMIAYGNFESNLRAEPLLTLARSTLDALDEGAVGRITYYAKIGDDRPRSSPRGVPGVNVAPPTTPQHVPEWGTAAVPRAVAVV